MKRVFRATISLQVLLAKSFSKFIFLKTAGYIRFCVYALRSDVFFGSKSSNKMLSLKPSLTWRLDEQFVSLKTKSNQIRKEIDMKMVKILGNSVTLLIASILTSGCAGNSALSTMIG